MKIKCGGDFWRSARQAFIDTVHTWIGSEDNIPFGVQEGTQTDPSQLVEKYRWTIQAMIQSYIRLGELCLLAVTIIDIVGIIRPRKAFVSS